MGEYLGNASLALGGAGAGANWSSEETVVDNARLAADAVDTDEDRNATNMNYQVKKTLLAIHLPYAEQNKH